MSRRRTATRHGLDCDVVVVGAGAAGLATAMLLEAAGHRARVLEQGPRAGESWWRRYEGLRLNTPRWLSDLPLLRMSARHGRWPERLAWAEYLQEYAGGLRDVTFGCEVTRLDRRPEGWTVTTSHGEVRCQHVVIATGHDRVPVVPDWPGATNFAGRIVHSHDYRGPADLTGKRVLVVGSGNSGAEIAAQLATRTAAPVRISIRTPPLILRRDIGGVPVTVWGELLRPLPDQFIDWSGRLLHGALWGDLRRYGLERPKDRLSAMRHTYYSPPLDSGFVQAVKDGDIEVVQALEGFDERCVKLRSRDLDDVDVVIAATGFRPGLEPLVGHLGVLDEDGEPKALAPPHGPFFAGFRFGLLALLPYIEGDARQIASAIGSSRSGHKTSLRRPLKWGGLRP